MPATRRLFFAIEVPADIQQQIIQWRTQCFDDTTGRPVQARGLHITLAFLGEISAEKTRALCTLAGRIQQPGFVLHVDDAGHQPRSQVIWLGPKHSPRGLLQLAALLRAQAARSGCSQSLYPYHPHMTLFRQTRQHVILPPPGFSWRWDVSDFVLYESRFDKGATRYRAIGRWPL